MPGKEQLRTILIVGLNYLPESTSIGPYTADLARYLRERGHDVRVVTGFPTAPQWKVWKGYEGRWLMRETVDGVPVTRTWLYVPKNPRKPIRRILFDCSFAVSALFGALCGKRPDLVIVVSPPLQLGLTALAIAAVTGAQVLLQIQDLVPDAAIAVGHLREGSRAIRIAYWLERLIYRRVNAIGVICEGMRKNLLSKGVPESKVRLLPNYIDLDFIRPLPPAGSFRSRFGIGAQEFVAMYSGSVAGKQGLQTYVEASASFENDRDIRCCLIGEGAYLTELRQIARNLALRRFTFLPMQPRETLCEQLSAADVLVITQRREVRDIVFPGKLLYYMASGRPILASVNEDSETGRFISDHQVGIVVKPEDSGALAEALRWMRLNPERARKLGQNGRRVAETLFDRRIVLGNFARLVESGNYPLGCTAPHTVNT